MMSLHESLAMLKRFVLLQNEKKVIFSQFQASKLLTGCGIHEREPTLRVRQTGHELDSEQIAVRKILCPGIYGSI